MSIVGLTRKISAKKMKVKINSLKLSSYGDSTESSGTVKIEADVKEPLKGKDVIIVEDIVDTGNTLDFIIHHLGHKKPKSIKVCALLNKSDRRLSEHARLRMHFLFIPFIRPYCLKGVFRA